MRHPYHPLHHAGLALLMAAGFGLALPVMAQTPVADDAPIVIESLSSGQLQEVVGPVALYPDDLLAVVLPASAYPLQIVQATRFLDELEQDSSLKPDPTWDESVVALLNYPDVLRMMNDDLDWTYDLGAAVVNQQPDVIAAIETFRDRAYDAGNLKSDERQRIEREDDRITITPVEREVIYVPYYEPQRVVVVQSTPAYYYYPRPYPLYYYPYPTYYDFHRPYFFGVTSVFQIGWPSRHLNIHLWNYASHPFYGRRYVNRYYYHHRHQPARYRYRPHSDSRGGYVNVRARGNRGDQWRPVSTQRSVRSLGENRQRAARINRDGYVSSFKPRDPRDRRLATAGRSERTPNTRALAPKTRYQTDTATRTTQRDRVARANAGSGNTTVAPRQRSERTTTSTQREHSERTTTTAPRQRTERTTTTVRQRPVQPEARQYRSAGASESVRAREYRTAAPTVRQRSSTASRPQAASRPAPPRTPAAARARNAEPAARPAARQSEAQPQRAQSETQRVQRSQPRAARKAKSRSKETGSARRDRR